MNCNAMTEYVVRKQPQGIDNTSCISMFNIINILYDYEANIRQFC